MKPELITSLGQITPAWLTRVLGKNVAEVSYESGETSFCITARIRVTYTSNATARFFLKFSKPVNPVSIPEGGWEVVFYKSVAPPKRSRMSNKTTGNRFFIRIIRG